MELKNAVSVCLISLFSATLVILIARSLDSQAASRLEPQLASIVEELRALREQGGIAAAPGSPARTEAVGDGLVVYYFHSNTRCPTCQSIESQTQATVQNHFARQLSDGEVMWKIVNYEETAAKPLATQFEIQMPVVVLARMKDGKVDDWKRLDEVWGLVDDKPAFAKYVQDSITQMLAPEKQPPATAQSPGPVIPAPNTEKTSMPETSAIPIP